ncbi:MAG: hypothetical protein ACRD28_13780 [Acidobacteriaceae bacterium]
MEVLGKFKVQDDALQADGGIPNKFRAGFVPPFFQAKEQHTVNVQYPSQLNEPGLKNGGMPEK